MEPILTREQIAELLEGIKSGRISTDLKGVNDRINPASVKSVNLFEMGSETDDQQRIPNFDIILDNFAQNFAITLTNLLQRNFNITRTGIDNLEFQEYLLSQKEAGAIGVLSMSPLKNGALMVLDSELCFSLVEIMLGASMEIAPLHLKRKPTTIELNVLKSTMLKACSDIDKALKPIIDLESSIVKVESNSRLVSITESDSEILAAKFQVKVGNLSGSFDMVFPVATLEPLREQLRELLTVKTVKESGWQDILKYEMGMMAATVVARSGTITMPVRKVMRMKKGDIVSIDYDPNSPLTVLVEERHKFFAIPGTVNGKKAIHLTGVYNPGESYD